MSKQHHYQTHLTWTGNQGSGTSDYKSYNRNYFITVENKPDIPGSSDPAFRGDKNRYNPEELLLSSLSSCHMLWYLHLCADAGVVVLDYTDSASGVMVETPAGGGHFESVVLNPIVTVADDSMLEKANQLHKKANQLCFIANSVNFRVEHNPQVLVK